MSGKRIPNAAIGVLFIVLVIVGFYFAFNKHALSGGGLEIKALFRDSQGLLPDSPVRIAGVNVGRVTEIESVGPSSYGDGAAVVTMEIRDAGLPIHSDAHIQIRPRLFLGGNYFLEVDPGSPSAPELEAGATLPVGQTANSVQIDEILTALQADARGNLQLLLRELGTALERGGAAGLRSLYSDSFPALRYGSQVNEALLGTSPHDLSSLIRNLDRTFLALHRDPPALAGLITNLAVTTGSFAAQDRQLEAAIAELPLLIRRGRPALAALNGSLPFVRALAREALPGVRGAGPAIKAATPLLAQLEGLLSAPELGGLATDLRRALPPLAKLTRRTIPFMEQARALSSCFEQVVIPWSLDEVVDPNEPAAGSVHQETAYALTGLSGIARSGDANGYYARTGPSGGNNTVTFPPVLPGQEQLGGTSPFAITGTMPAMDSSRRTRFRPQVPCETQESPDLRSELGPAPQQRTVSSRSEGLPGELYSLSRSYAGALMTRAGSLDALQRRYEDMLGELDPLLAKLFAGAGADQRRGGSR